jgi:hypothetical protein
MAISNELSSDIAAALITDQNRSQRELNELKDVLFTIHSTLQEMTYDPQAKAKPETARPRPSKSE